MPQVISNRREAESSPRPKGWPSRPVDSARTVAAAACGSAPSWATRNNASAVDAPLVSSRPAEVGGVVGATVCYGTPCHKLHEDFPRLGADAPTEAAAAAVERRGGSAGAGGAEGQRPGVAQVSAWSRSGQVQAL